MENEQKPKNKHQTQIIKNRKLEKREAPLWLDPKRRERVASGRRPGGIRTVPRGQFWPSWHGGNEKKEEISKNKKSKTKHK
jgi:hypothetical protein